MARRKLPVIADEVLDHFVNDPVNASDANFTIGFLLNLPK